MVERGLVGGCSQNGCGFAPHAAVTYPVIINGRHEDPGSSLNGVRSVNTVEVNVEHAQRSEHERR
jgi:hypothetical protein